MDITAAAAATEQVEKKNEKRFVMDRNYTIGVWEVKNFTDRQPDRNNNSVYNERHRAVSNDPFRKRTKQIHKWTG